jgi:hypothetical protein
MGSFYKTVSSAIKLCSYFLFIVRENIFACALYPVFEINPLKHDVRVKNSVPASQHAYCLCIIKINRLLMVRKIIPVYSQNYPKPPDTLCGQNAMCYNVKYSYTVVPLCFKGSTFNVAQWYV